MTAIDHPGEPVTLNDAFGALFPSAVHLFVGDHWTGEIVSARPSVQIGRHDLVFELHSGSLIRATSDNR